MGGVVRMKLFYKTSEAFFYGDYQDYNLPKLSGKIHLGIDGSTTSFGVALTDEEHKNHVIMMFIREEETHDEFFRILFPMLQMMLYQCEIETATYEKTPTDFDKDTHAIRVMKNTERAVGNFLSSGTFVRVKHKFNIYDIFPNSWKAFLVNSNPDENYRKTDKHINAVDILTVLGLDVSHWIHEANTISGHSYDAFEAMGICAYGSKFIYQGIFTTTYRNFKKRRPLQVLFKETTWNDFSVDAKAFKTLLGEPPMALMIPNKYHSFMENLYALDSDDRVNIMVVSPDDFKDLHLYYKFITGVKGILMLTVTRTGVSKHSFGSLYI